MEVILSKNCLTLTGTLAGCGYSLRQRGKRFFSTRNSQGFVPPDGHWRFIVLCAELAKNGLHITDISVSRDELKSALYEAHIFIAMQQLRKDSYTASDILNLKTTFGL